MNNIEPISVSEYEKAWRLEDSLEVLKKINKQRRIILGGDILNKNLQHNYDSWYYESLENDTIIKSVKDSYVKACEYIQAYIKKNGKDFYVIIVTD